MAKKAGQVTEMAGMYKGAEPETVETRHGGFWNRGRFRQELYNARAGFALIFLGVGLMLLLTGRLDTMSAVLTTKNVIDAGWWILISKVFYTTVLPFIRVLPTTEELDKGGWTMTLAVRSAGMAALSAAVILGAALIVAI